MSEIAWMKFLKVLSLVCNSLGILIALAFLFGPKVLTKITNILDQNHPFIALEQLLVKKARLILGITLFVVTIIMLILATSIKV